MKFKAIIILGLLTLSFAAFSQQQYSGTINDAATQEPLVGASVFIKSLKKGTTADKNGKYALNIPKGTYYVEVSFIGYKTQTRQIAITNKAVKQNFRLEPSVEALDAVQITAKSKAREIQEQATPVSVITMDQIQGAVSNVQELLTKTSGIKIRRSGGVGSTSRVSLRGLEGKRVGLFINGTPLADQSDHIDLNDIPIDLIERIEVYKGIVPAKFGGSAIGGAVNIVTKEYPPQYTDISYSLQSYNTHNASLVYKRNNKEKGYEYGAGGFYTYSANNYEFDSPFQPGLRVKRDHDVFEKKLIAGAFKAKKWWFDAVEIEPVIIQTRKEIQGVKHNIQEAVSYATAMAMATKLEKEDFLIEGLDFENSLLYAYTIFKFQDKAKQRYNWDGSTYPAATSLGGEIGTNPNDSRNQKHTLLQKANLNYILNKNSSLNLNTVFNYAHGIPKDDLKDQVIGRKTNFNSTMKSFVSGLNYQTHFFNKKLSNSASVKYYQYNIKTTMVALAGIGEPKPHNYSKNDFGFSNAIRYRFTPELLIKASYAYDVRLPSENELLGDGFIIAPAGNLEPERSNGFNIGLMYDHSNNKNNRLQLELNLFYTELENMIRFTGGFLQSQYQNFGQMRTKGIEGDIKWDATNFLYLYANATYQDLRDTREKAIGSSLENPTKGDRMPNIPYLYANAGFELHKKNLFGGKEQNSKFYFESLFVEEYFYDFEQSIHQTRRIPRSISYNLGLEHSFKNKNIIIGLQINNITNEILISEFQRPLPGRTLGLKLRYIMK